MTNAPLRAKPGLPPAVIVSSRQGRRQGLWCGGIKGSAMRTSSQVTLVVLSAMICALAGPRAALAARNIQQVEGEVYLPNAEYDRLDRFEALALDKADKVYSEAKYRQALTEYDSFLREYPRSSATPYAVLRKGRCLHRDDKRNAAIRQYAEVLDYFPTVVEYAGAALYYQGLAAMENGDEDKAIKYWSQMAQDKGYSKHPLAAGAINRLADNLVAKGRVEPAMAYFWQVAVDFRQTYPQMADYARQQVIAFYIRTSPNEPKLRAFFSQSWALKNQQSSEEQLVANFEYWDDLRGRAAAAGPTFTDKEAELKTRFYAYWGKALDGKFLDHDDYRIAVIGFQRLADKDAATWTRRLDDQFTKGGKTDDPERIAKWVVAFHTVKAKMMDYYNRVDFSKMSNAQIAVMMKALYETGTQGPMARNVFAKLNLGKMPDEEKVQLARWLWEKDADCGKQTCESMQDKDLGKHELLDHYHHVRDTKNGLAMADQLVGSPRFATDSLYKKGEMLEWSNKWPEAILAYRQVNDQPNNLWRIASCYEKMGQIDKAITQLQEVENFFKDFSGQAALKIAKVYKRNNLPEKSVAAFRRVLIKYPQTPQSADAHSELEAMGITRIRGGVGDSKEDK
jgi:TolA-binding protein